MKIKNSFNNIFFLYSVVICFVACCTISAMEEREDGSRMPYNASAEEDSHRSPERTRFEVTEEQPGYLSSTSSSNSTMSDIEALEDSNGKRHREESDEEENSHRPVKKRKLEKRSKEEQEKLDKNLMYSLNYSNFLMPLADYIAQGARVSENNVRHALISFESFGWLVPYILMLENGTMDINMRSSFDDGSPYFSYFFSNLPFAFDTILNGERYSQSDWRRWDDTRDNKYQKTIPKFYRTIAKYPRGPFTELSDWKNLSKKNKLERTRCEIFEWFFEQGIDINIEDRLGRPLLEQLVHLLQNKREQQKLSAVHSLSLAIFWLVNRGACIDALTKEIKEMVKELFPEAMYRHVLFNEQEKFTEELEKIVCTLKESIMSNPDLSKKIRFILENCLLIAAGQGRIEMVDLLLEKTEKLFDEVILQEALTGAASIGCRTMFEILLKRVNTKHDNFSNTLNRSILRAAVHGHLNIITYIREDHEGLMSFLDPELLQRAFVRSARLGHCEVIQELYRLLGNIAKKDPTRGVFGVRVFTEAVRAAAMSRNIDVLKFLLDLDGEKGFALDTGPIEKILSNILANPSLPAQEEQEYLKVMNILTNHAQTRVVRQIWQNKVDEANNQTSSDQPPSYLSQVPYEICLRIFSAMRRVE